jgi:sec-independent protein translocase protein TatB
MFDIGFSELVVIAVVALIVVGPERMPQLVRTSGQWMGRLQRMARELRAEFEREANSQEFGALNQEFLAEDRRLKELARTPPPAAKSDDSA